MTTKNLFLTGRQVFDLKFACLAPRTKLTTGERIFAPEGVEMYI